MNDLNVLIDQKTARILELENKAEEDATAMGILQAEKTNLQNEITSLTTIKESLESTISANEQTIATLQQDKLELQNEITRLNGLIAGYEDIAQGTCEVDFYVGETLSTVKVVRYNNTIEETIETPVKKHHDFLGWARTPDGEVVDISTIKITERTSFYAIFQEAPGLYNSETGAKVYTWEELISNNIITDNNGDVSSNYNNRNQLSGELVVKSGTTKISNFSNCTNLTAVILPETVTELGSQAFSYCSNLTNIELPNTLELIGAEAFRSSGITSVVIPTSVTTINKGAFSFCKQLTEVKFLNDITSLNVEIIFGGSGLVNFTIPNSVTELGSNAFVACTSLKTVYIPSSVTSILSNGSYKYTFAQCSDNLIIYCESESKQAGWADDWNYSATGKSLTVKYGYTYEEYLAEINQGE